MPSSASITAPPRPERYLAFRMRVSCRFTSERKLADVYCARVCVCMCACVRVFESYHQCNTVIGTTQRSLRRPDYEEPFILVPVLTLFDDARCHLLSWSCANCSRPILWSSACAFCPEDVVLPILVVLLVALVLLVHCYYREPL